MYKTNIFFDRNANDTMKTSKNPRYIDTRVDELFPSRKNSLRLKIQSGKEHVKVCIIKYPVI